MSSFAKKEQGNVRGKIRNVSNIYARDSLRQKRKKRERTKKISILKRGNSLKIFFFLRFIATSMTSMENETLLKMNFPSLFFSLMFKFVYTFVYCVVVVPVMVTSKALTKYKLNASAMILFENP